LKSSGLHAAAAAGGVGTNLLLPVPVHSIHIGGGEMAGHADPWFELKVAAHRLRRFVSWGLHWRGFANGRAPAADFPCLLFRHESRLVREGEPMERGKRHNVALALPRFDGLVQHPGQLLSFCRLLGPITYRRGFVDGWELFGDRLGPGVGGGLCALANMIHWLALNTGMAVPERHRHPYDLFPDQERTVPFGVGVTIYYNYVDLQVRHALPGPVRWHLCLEGDTLVGEVWATQPLAAPVQVWETDHRFELDHDGRWRANRLWRRSGDAVELLAENRCRCLY